MGKNSSLLFRVLCLSENEFRSTIYIFLIGFECMHFFSNRFFSAHKDMRKFKFRCYDSWGKTQTLAQHSTLSTFQGKFAANSIFRLAS